MSHNLEITGASPAAAFKKPLVLQYPAFESFRGQTGENNGKPQVKLEAEEGARGGGGWRSRGAPKGSPGGSQEGSFTWG